MNREEKFLMEQKLNQLRARFISPNGKLDQFVIGKFNELSGSAKKLGFNVELNDKANILVLREIV